MKRYSVVAGRIYQELSNLERVVNRIERALTYVRQRPEDLDFYIDSIALNLHDFYAGLERLFEQIATKIDDSLPTGSNWHQDLLRQMGDSLPQLRPHVLGPETMKLLDEYLRFRHVVRNIYTFEFDPERIERLGKRLQPAFFRARQDLLAFAHFLEQLTQDIPPN